MFVGKHAHVACKILTLQQILCLVAVGFHGDDEIATQLGEVWPAIFVGDIAGYKAALSIGTGSDLNVAASIQVVQLVQVFIKFGSASMFTELKLSMLFISRLRREHSNSKPNK